jgi:tRNA(Ile)-lysidine synthase
MDVIDKTASTVRKHSMLQGGERVLIGLSGGPDSVCLAIVLDRLKLRLKLDLHAIYIDHGLRPDETPMEADFCRKLCKGMDIPLEVEMADVKSYVAQHGMNKQEAARDLRYLHLEHRAQAIKADRIALGHNLDDQVETFFMRILRGSGMRGLSGIPPVRGIIIRPLIETERVEIESFLEQEKAGFITDSSNLRDDYLRNRLRSRLMPVLKELNPSVLKTLAHTADVFREEERYFEIAVTKALMKLICKKNDDSIELFMIPLESMDRVLLRRVLRRALEETRGLRGIGYIHIEDIIGLIKDGKPGDRVYLPKGTRIIKKYSTVLFTTEPPMRLESREIVSEGNVLLDEAGLVIKASVSDVSVEVDDGRRQAVFDADRTPFPLKVRAREKGDFFYPLGFGKRKKLQDFFVDEKVPRDERDTVPLVVCEGDIVWVAGHRGDERFSVTGDTKRHLLLELRQARPEGG